MSNPRIKRPFAGSSADPAQRQITSFFPPSSPSRTVQSTEPAPEAQAQPARQPLLPSSVQANLLSVGMRIRKSVPEGYKTCAPSAFALWTDHSTPAASAPSLARRGAPSNELVPFCGINKIGGLGIQPNPARDDDSDYASDDQLHLPYEDSVPELTLSQESVESTAPDPPSRKRLYTENELHEAPTMLARPRRGWDEEVSPRSFAPSEWRSSRVMAVPKPRVRKSVWLNGPGREGGDGDEDFEEAEFLVFGEGAHEMDIS
ncbi:hypothetical protein E4U42_005492 [Claviceps africana]|uniref:Uncharacterized protein n=1 Tax=Claviceps africana TaxID=83212 RepID=A0A8K0J3P2_9HYPO|nr:hypothetical protein E4U42_005492 [Claviceps africana]